MDHIHKTRKIHIKPHHHRRRTDHPTEDQYPPFPPPHVVLHPEDAGSKVFLAVARAFISVDNRAMTIKDIADRAGRYGLVCQNLSAAAQAVTTYLRAHKTRCDQQDDYPLLLSHTLSGTPADDDLVPALYSRSGGDSHPLTNRLTNFRKGTAVWYLSRATGVPCPFTKAGIRLCDYVHPEMQEQCEKSSRRDRKQELCGQKRKRPLRGCVGGGRANDSDNERPPKVKLTLRLKPLLVRVQSSESSRPFQVSKADSDSSYDSGDEDSMSVDSSSSSDESHTAQLNKLEEEKPWSLPPYPRRSISIPCYTPSVEPYYLPAAPSLYRDPFRRSPSLPSSVATPPPDSEDEADDFHVTMTRIKNYPEQFSQEDDTDLGWEADLDSEGDGETMWESPGPRSPSAPLIQPSEVAVKEEPRDVQGMLDAWDDFDSSFAETRVAEVLAKVLDPEHLKVKVEVTDPWDWDANSGVHAEWATEETARIKQEDFGVDSLFLPGPSSSPLSPVSALSSHSETSSPPRASEDTTDWDERQNYRTIRPRAKTVPAPSPFYQGSTPARHSVSSASSREPPAPSTALVTLLQSMSVDTSVSETFSVHLPPPAPCVSPLQTRCLPSASSIPPVPRVVVHTCQPCHPAISATQIEDISVYQMMLGAFQLLRRIDTDFVNLSPIVAYSGTPPSSGSGSDNTQSSSHPQAGVITNATVITKGSPEICGTWVSLTSAQAYVRTHLAGEAAALLEVFLGDALVERFPSALQDFYRTNRGARRLNQFGRHFASTLVAGGLPMGVSECVGAVPGGFGSGVGETAKVLGPGINTVVLPTPSFVLGLGDVEDGDVPLSATEQEIFHELCVIPPDWENAGSTSVLVVEDVAMAEENLVVVEALPPTPTTAKAAHVRHRSSGSVSSISSLSSSADSDSGSAPTSVPAKAAPAVPIDDRPLRRSKRVASALAASAVQPSRAKSRKGGARNSLS